MIFIIQEEVLKQIYQYIKMKIFKITDIKHEIIAPFNTDLKFSNENKLASNRINYFYKGLINQKESYQDLYQEWHGIP